MHGRYLRRLADAAISGSAVVIELLVRRFKCLSDGCPAGTFAEQVLRLAPPHTRHTRPLRQAIGQIPLATARPVPAHAPQYSDR